MPHALRVAKPTVASSKPLYYLPYKLLPFQEDQIENQIAAVKSAIRKEKDAWEDAKGEKVDELGKAKRRRDEQLEERERGEREQRQKRRREQEDKEEKAREAKRNAGDVEMVERSKVDVVNEADGDDIAMATAPVPVEEDEAKANGVDAVAEKDDKMEGGEEDLEY